MPRHSRSRRKKADPNAKLYIFKVALAAQQRIWRRIAVRSDQTLDDLHAAIFDAFNRDDEHLYSFYLPHPGAASRSRPRGGAEYTSPMMLEQVDSWGDREIYNAGVTAISSLGLKVGSRLGYLFDFGDEWWHEITVEESSAALGPGRYPRIIEKHGASPPQYSYPEDDDEQ